MVINVIILLEDFEGRTRCWTSSIGRVHKFTLIGRNFYCSRHHKQFTGWSHAMCKSLLKSSGVRTLANVNIVNIEIIAGAISAEASVLKDTFL